jgi:putative transposase
MEHQRRKSLRLKDYDYSQHGAYFITICAKDRKCLFGQIVVADDPVRQNTIHLSAIGNIVSDCWNTIARIYPEVRVDKHIIMPNHVHGIIIIGNNGNDQISNGGQRRPPLQKIVQGFKSVSTRRCFPLGYSTVWQRSYYDHIVRNEQEYLEIWEYIDSNMQKWHTDIYFET